MDEISSVSGVDEVMVVGEPAWHRKGKVRETAATAAEAIVDAGLDWTVSKYDMFCETPGNSKTKVPDTYAVMRSDTIDSLNPVILGTVGNRYTVLQNKAAFNFFDHVVGEGAAVYQTAGALFDGRRIWISAKLPDNIPVVGDDVVDQYLLLTNTHDGTSSVQVYFTPTRVVCWNTLSMSMGTASREMRIRHTTSMHDNLKIASRVMGVISQRSSATKEVFQAMTKVDMTTSTLAEYFNALYPAPKPKKDEEKATGRSVTIYNNRMETLTSLFEASPTIADVPGARGTLWGAYNAVTQYVDHVQSDTSEDKKTQRILFAGGRDIKIDAYDNAEKIASAVA